MRTGELAQCRYLTVEVRVRGHVGVHRTSAVGARAYTASASQGLLFMAEAVFNASGLGLPIVMTVANRAIGAPINIWNDHSDAMALRDAGWIQLYAARRAGATDLHLQAFVVAERTSLPVMVCMDGFVLTHAVEEVDLPEQEQVDAFVRRSSRSSCWTPDDPVTIGAMVGPEAFTEVRYLMQQRMDTAIRDRGRVAHDFREAFGRSSGGWSAATGWRTPTPCSSPSARSPGPPPGRRRAARAGHRRRHPDPHLLPALARQAVRGPWPERGGSWCSSAPSASAARGIVGQDVRDSLHDLPVTVVGAVGGLGGRPVRRSDVRRLVEGVAADLLPTGRLHFLDLDHALLASAGVR